VITRSLEHKKQVPHFLMNPISDALAVIVSSGTLVRVMCKAVRMHASQYEWPCLFKGNSETCSNFVCRTCLGIVSCGNDYTASVRRNSIPRDAEVLLHFLPVGLHGFLNLSTLAWNDPGSGSPSHVHVLLKILSGFGIGWFW
jgi:hypothetical protein